MNNLAGVSQVSFFETDLKNTTPWFIDIMLSERRDELIEHLKENSVGSRVMYPPINEQECYNIAGTYPVSKSVGKQGLWLPSSGQLTDIEIDKVCNLIKEFYL